MTATDQTPGHQTPTDQTLDRAGVEAALERIRAAWDAGDAAAYAAEFTEDASYVIFAGILSSGRAGIARDHVPVFEKWQRGTKMSMRLLELHFATPDVAITVTEGGLGKGSRIGFDKVQTFVFVRQGPVWRCTAFQNTKKNRLFIAVNRRALAA